MTLAAIALGANLGPARDNVARAIDRVAAPRRSRRHLPSSGDDG